MIHPAGMSEIEYRSGLPILLFSDQAAFESWISTQGPGAQGAWLRFAKKNSGVISLSKAEAIDVALCHGWIDGQLDKYDDASWVVRFTPRRRGSKWSEVNRTRALELIEAGRMRRNGLAEIEAARTDGRWAAAYAPSSRAEVPADLQAELDRSPTASAFFATLTGCEPLRDPVPHWFGEEAGNPCAPHRRLRFHAGTRRDRSWLQVLAAASAARHLRPGAKPKRNKA